MKILKQEKTTKTHFEDSVFVEQILIYHYDTREERQVHLAEMQDKGYEDTGQVRKTNDINDISKYVWYAEYYRRYTEERQGDKDV